MPKLIVKGLEMYYELEGAGPPVVLLPPLSQDHYAWGMQLPALAAAGYQTLALDNRDAGQTAQSTAPYTIRQFAEDAVGLMDAVGVAQARVVGGSMGGMIAQEIAIHYPDRVLSLTLVCTAASIEPELAGVIRAWRAARPHVPDDEFVQALSAWLFTHRFYQEVEAARGFMELVRGNPFPQSAAGFQRQCTAILSHDTVDRLERITAPTHVIVGAEDVLTPPRYSRALAAAISRARLTVVPGGAHALFNEIPDVFNRAMLQFLDAQPKPTTV
jgi:pimeloyl-ACP methyl ester carboxylesterase